MFADGLKVPGRKSGLMTQASPHVPPGKRIGGPSKAGKLADCSPLQVSTAHTESIHTVWHIYPYVHSGCLGFGELQ